MKKGIVWLASYVKSGNTMLRLLLEAEFRNGALDINHTKLGVGDSGKALMDAVSPLPTADLNFRGEALLRPAALLHLMVRHNDPNLPVKTHWANLKPRDLPPYIPSDLTACAVYVVRDPRDVFLSFCNYFSMPPDKTLEVMSEKGFTLGGSQNAKQCRSLVSSWSNHVASWVGEKEFPVHIVRYEDMVADPGKELREVLEFLEKPVNEDRIAAAVEATRIDKLQAIENAEGFSENKGKGSFFGGGGGSRWREELGPKYAKAIEEQHGDMMRVLDYLPKPDNVEDIDGRLEHKRL